MAVIEEQRAKEAMASKPRAQPEDDLEVRARKVMGVVEDGDAVFGAGAEINLDSQVLTFSL